MVEDKNETRELSWRHLLPWTEIFRGFAVALDLNKLLLAAAGILMMSFGWWLLAVIFGAAYNGPPTGWPSNFKRDGTTDAEAWSNFKREREQWNLMHEATGQSSSAVWEVADIAESAAEYNLVKETLDKNGNNLDALDKFAMLPGEKAPSGERILDAAQLRLYKSRLGRSKPEGTLARMPWSEDRGTNPYLLVTGQAGVPWEPGRAWEWFSRDQLPVLTEPLVKLVRPVVYFFSPRADGFVTKLYFLLAFGWTVFTWSIFGGAITRIAAVQVARPGEPVGLSEAFRFATKRLLSYVAAPLFPLAAVFALLVFGAIFGYLHAIPFIGDILIDGLLWGLMLLLGLVMALALVGLAVGWPLMAPTVSAEGTDSWEALSRSFSYVFQRPWQYAWYCLVALAYGAVVIFFVGFMGSLTVYLSKWAIAQTPGISYFNRDPSYLFVYAPKSFGWRELLLEGTKDAGTNVVQDGHIDQKTYDSYVGKLNWWNKVGAGMVAFWLGLVFLLILGFGYSFFFSTTTIIYLLMRKSVDAAELDEVYLEEDDQDVYSGPLAAPPPEPAKAPSAAQMVDAPSLRSVTPPVPPPPSPPAVAAAPPPTPTPEPPGPAGATPTS